MKLLIFVITLVVLTACHHIPSEDAEKTPLYFRQEGLSWIDKNVGQKIRVQGVMIAPEPKGPGGYGVLSDSNTVMYVRGNYPELVGFLVEAEGQLVEIHDPSPAGMQQGIPGGVLMYWLETPSVRKIEHSRLTIEVIQQPS